MLTKDSKKLTGNGFWESSRMMLPEHKIALNENFKELKRRQRIELDDQEWQDISRIVYESMQQRRLIAIKMYHPFEDLQIVGVVDRVDPINKRFMVDGEWFPIRDIEGAGFEA